MTGLIFSVIIPIFSVRPLNAQDIVDKQNGVWIGGTGCNDYKYISAHNYKPLGAKIEKINSGDTIRIGKCSYNVISKKEYQVGANANDILVGNYTYLQTCKGKTDYVYVLTLKNRIRSVKKMK